MFLIAGLLLILYALLFGYTLHAVIKGELKAILFFVVLFFPIYANFLTINYDAFESPILLKIIQYSKEVIIFGALTLWFFGQKNSIKKQWDVSVLDGFFIVFLFLSFIFFVLGIGEATFTNRAIYLKNIILICVFYFFGRNVHVSFADWTRVFKIVCILSVVAAGVVLMEAIIGRHFHTLTGYSKYAWEINGIESGGIYGLAWTFEAEGGHPRYGSIFAHPLELASSMLLAAAVSIVYLVSVPFNSNKLKYLGILGCTFICVLLAYSRASFVAYFMMFVFIAFLLRYYKILTAVLYASLGVAFFVLFFAGDEILFFVLDTISFRNSSSLTHMVEWLEALESMVSNPFGIGLAMSGNASGVDRDLMVGGENQFLIYGVQMGILGMLIYIGMLSLGIRNSWRAFRLSNNRQEAIVPFIASSVKFGLLLPLFTANAEVYIYVSLVSWWLIGYGESVYQKNRNKRSNLRFN